MNKKNRTILFVIPTLGGGGAERIVSYLATSLSSSDYFDVSILLLRSEGNNYLQNLPPQVTVHNLALKGSLQKNVFLIAKRILDLRPKICFLGLDALNLLLSPFIPIFKFYGIKLIVRETNVLSLRWKKWKFQWLLKLVYRLFYNAYPLIVCQSEDMLTDLRENWKVTKPQIVKINNPIDSEAVILKSRLNYKIPYSVPYLVSVGRLHPQKGYVRLIENIGSLAAEKKFPYKLLILGEGPQRQEIENLITRLNICNHIQLLGFVENPYPIIKSAKGFLLSSEYEGFPNVLLEANVLGLPILANNCPGGINEIVIEGVNGYSCNFSDLSEFQTTFEKFLHTHFSAEVIRNLTISRFDKYEIIPKYTKLFMEIGE